jgi:hypothetical protein
VPTPVNDADRLLTEIGNLDGKLASLGPAERQQVMQKLLAIGARWIAPPETSGATVAQGDLTDEELFELIEQQEASANLLRGAS